MNSTHYLFAILMIFTVLSCAKEEPDKEVYIYGTVKDRNTNEPLSGAMVYFQWENDGWLKKIDSTSTNENGYYEIAVDFEIVILSSYSLGVEHSGYADTHVRLKNSDVPKIEHSIIERNFSLTP